MPTRWIHEPGWIDLDPDGCQASMVRTRRGRMSWEGAFNTPMLDEPPRDLEAGITA